jgi:molecular chaperone GrpE (heat shock protein)
MKFEIEISPIDLRIHIKPDPEVLARLDVLKQTLDLAMETIMTAMDDLNAAVQRNTDAESSVITLLQGISQQLKDALAANDPAAIKAVIDKIDANTAAAAAAVVANTPVAIP